MFVVETSYYGVSTFFCGRKTPKPQNQLCHPVGVHPPVCDATPSAFIVYIFHSAAKQFESKSIPFVKNNQRKRR